MSIKNKALHTGT